MSVPETTSPAPGWYPDLLGAASLRWWDGAGWTEFTEALPTADPELTSAAPDPGLETVGFRATTETPPSLEGDPGSAEPEPLSPGPAATVPPHGKPGSEVEPEPEESAVAALEVIQVRPAPRGLPEPLGPAAPIVIADPEATPVVESEREPFAFRTRPMELEPDVVAFEAGIVESLPVYASPLAVIKSPVAPLGASPPPASVPPAAPAVPAPAPALSPPVVEEPPGPPAPAPAPVPASVPAAAVSEDVRRSRRPGRRAVVGTAAVVVAAAGAAGATNLLHGEDPSSPGGANPLKPAPIAGAVADKSCLREWNIATSRDAAQLRVTLGQFSGALARVSRVKPLPGTLMEANGCGLTVYDPATDAHGVFVSGVKDQVGYLDVTAYPRAKQYGRPATDSQANVIIREDGSLRAR